MQHAFASGFVSRPLSQAANNWLRGGLRGVNGKSDPHGQVDEMRTIQTCDLDCSLLVTSMVREFIIYAKPTTSEESRCR